MLFRCLIMLEERAGYKAFEWQDSDQYHLNALLLIFPRLLFGISSYRGRPHTYHY